MRMSLDRRSAFRLGILGAAGAALGPVSSVSAEQARELQNAGTWIKWGYDRTGMPEGKPGDLMPLALVTAPDRVVAATMGRVDFIDKAGDKAEWPEKSKENATYLVVNEGEGVSVVTWATYAWVGVTERPNGTNPLTPGNMSELVAERSEAIRKFQPNTKHMNVLWVKDGLIHFTGTFRVR